MVRFFILIFFGCVSLGRFLVMLKIIMKNKYRIIKYLWVLGLEGYNDNVLYLGRRGEVESFFVITCIGWN